MMNYQEVSDYIKNLCGELSKYNRINMSEYKKYGVKRGLRNDDGTGVMAGLSQICNVHGYLINEGELMPIPGELIYRGIRINDIVDGCQAERRFGYEETVWLLLFGRLPNREQYDLIRALLGESRELDQGFVDDMIIKAPSNNIMNKMARSVLALYTYDDNPEEQTVENVLRQSIRLIAQFPSIMVAAYQVKRRHYDNESMYFHPFNKAHSTAESILSTMRADMMFTEDEARLLDLMLILHAEHGGGNNSTFTCRVLTSAATDTYSAIAGAIGSLKGSRHGGANHKVMQQLEYLKNDIKDWKDEDEIRAYLCKMVDKEAGDRSGLIYGMGHAVYTLSDPRAVILKKYARNLVKRKGMEDEFGLLEQVEKLAPGVLAEKKGDGKSICANVDLYSGLIYKMLGIPPELYTPMFAVARIAGWCAHRIEEMMNGNRIIRPAYKSLARPEKYVSMDDRK